MNVDPCEVDALVASLLSSKLEFSLEEACSHLSDSCNSAGLREVLEQDRRFLRIWDENGLKTFMPRHALAKYLADLNVRLAKAGISYSGCTHIASLLRHVCCVSTPRWDGIPESVLEFAEHYGLVRRTLEGSSFCFPLARILIQITGNYKGATKRKTSELAHQNFIELVLRGVTGSTATSSEVFENLLSDIPYRQRIILLLRSGIGSGRRSTLEQIGRKLDVTRERVRQLELKALKCVKTKENARQLEIALLGYIIERGGGLLQLLNPENSNLLSFLCEQCGVPFARWPELGYGILGFNVAPPSASDLKKLLLARKSVAQALPTPLLKGLPSEDALAVIQLLEFHAHGKFTKGERVYWAMKEIGRPAHFSKIARMHNQMFPEHRSEAHNVHAALTRKEDTKIVWTGLKGVYALKEWGFEQPNRDLFETVAEIVEEIYRKTSSPVSLFAVFAKMGKYRKLYNRNSVMMALQFNAKLVCIESTKFIPRSASDADAVAADENELDRILRKFERE